MFHLEPFPATLRILRRSTPAQINPFSQTQPSTHDATADAIRDGLSGSILAELAFLTMHEEFASKETETETFDDIS
jgi:hypothetical protein